MANEFKIKKGLIVTGADGGTVVDIQGSQGQLFSVTDDLSGSIFAVSDISGVPILDVNSSGLSTFDGNVNLPDNKKILLGTGNDIELYHDGTHSHIINNTGDLTIDSQGDDLLLKAADDLLLFVQGTEVALQAIGNAGVKIRYNNVVKFETTSSGVSVTGEGIFTGNVGIGITLPTNPLTVDFAPYGIGSITTSNNATAWNTSSAIMLRGASGSNGLGFGISGTANDRKSWIQSGHPSQQYANYLGTLAINPLGGNVGIGTTSPGAKLDVNSSISSSSADVIKLSQNTNGAVKAAASLGLSIQNGGEATNAADLWFTTATNGSLAERMRITSSGNVAIGATSSSHKLLVSSSDNNVLKLINEELNYGANQQSILFQGVWWNGDPGALTNTARIAGTHRSNGYHSGGLNFYSYNNGAEVNAMTIIYNGNVGIGTNSPDAKLHIGESGAAAQLWLQRTDGYNPVKLIGGTLADGNGFKITMNTSDAFAITSSGNVGIGTTSPDAQLEISNLDAVTGQGGATLRLTRADLSAAAGDPVGTIDFYSTDADGPHTTAYIKSMSEELYGRKGSLAFGVSQAVNADATEAMRIDSNGNVGIGTTSPNGLLRVYGTGRTFNATSTSDQVVGSITRAGGSISTLGFNGTGSTSDYHVRIGANETSFVAYAGNIERMRIINSGNVGIGTGDPTAPLHIEGGTNGEVLKIEADANPYIRWVENGTDVGFLQFLGESAYLSNMGDGSFFFRTNNTDKMTITSSGNVGIGTTSPSETLEVSGKVRIFDGGYPYIDLGVSTSNYFRIIHDNPNDILKIGKNGASTSSSLIVQGGTGNVGIGGVPGSRFDIQGTQGQLFSVTDDLSGDIFSVADISGVPILNVNSSGLVTVDGTSYFDGNVGIGTNSPGAKLEIEGDATGDDTPQLIVASGGVDNNAIIHFTDDVGSQVNAIGALEGNILTFASQNELVFKTGTSSILGNTDTRMTIYTNGNVGIPDGGVGIGVTNPSAKLQVYRDDSTLAASLAEATSRASVKIRSSSTDGAHLVISQGASGCTQLQVSSTNATTPRNIKIQPFGGNVGIGTGTANPSDRLVVVGNVVATNFVLSSDERKKTKIKDLTCNNIDVNWRSFELKQHEGEYRTGVIAQELEQSHPEFVKTDNEGFKSVKYIDLLIAKIAELEARLEKLEK